MTDGSGRVHPGLSEEDEFTLSKSLMNREKTLDRRPSETYPESGKVRLQWKPRVSTR
jgi:hypothetical protein